jgi:3-oxoacyl-[acyl-carrier protein] reductase
MWGVETMANLTGRVAIITGGSRGIGRAIALRLARDGADVAIVFREQQNEAEAIRSQIVAEGRRCLSLQLDVADASAVNSVVERVRRELGRLDILVCNAGIFSRSTLIETSDDEFTRTFDVNVRGVFNCMRASLPHMIEQRWGRIINLSSQIAKRGAGTASKATYGATKAAVDAYTKGVAIEASPFGVTVNSVAPGWIEKTEPPAERPEHQRKMLEGIPVGRPGRPEDVAAVVSFLASDEASYITGEVVDVNGGSWMD